MWKYKFCTANDQLGAIAACSWRTRRHLWVVQERTLLKEKFLTLLAAETTDALREVAEAAGVSSAPSAEHVLCIDIETACAAAGVLGSSPGEILCR